MGSLFNQGGTRQGEGVGGGRVIASAGVVVTAQDKAVKGSGSAPALSAVDTDQMSYFVDLYYGISDRWAAGLTLPARLLEVSGERLSGVGDIQLRTTYRVVKGDGVSTPEVQVSAGFSLPTGETDLTVAGIRAGDPLQPGRGTVDPILSASLLHPLSDRWRAYASTSLRLGLQENSDGYEYGDSLAATVGGSFSIGHADIFTQLSWNHTERDHMNDQIVSRTGGDVLYVTPGVQFWATRKLSFRLQDQILTAHDVNEEQMLSRHSLSALAIVQF